MVHGQHERGTGTLKQGCRGIGLLREEDLKYSQASSMCRL
jgi:hypothetical protein